MTEGLAFLFGLLQGLTEFLPISSSGHFFLLKEFFSPDLSQNSLSFIILLHGATFLSVVTIFFKDLKSLTLSLHTKASRQLLLKVVVSSIPLGTVGLFFKKLVEESFQEIFVAMGFLTTALLLLSLLFKKKISSSPINNISYPKAFLIGISQAVAVFPGFSRSGWTIFTSLMTGLSPKDSVYYSFLLSLPAILATFLIEFVSHPQSLTFSFHHLLAFLTAYISGTISLYFVLKVVQKEKFFLFGFYLLPLSFYLILF